MGCALCDASDIDGELDIRGGGNIYGWGVHYVMQVILMENLI